MNTIVKLMGIGYRYGQHADINNEIYQEILNLDPSAPFAFCFCHSEEMIISENIRQICRIRNRFSQINSRENVRWSFIAKVY